jgi:protein-tyrosine phosphatase
MGNICRSPTGEGVMRKLVDDQGAIDQIEIDSAGTISYHQGNPADARMQQHAGARGYSLDSIARQVRADDFETFDLIVAMDRENESDLLSMSPPEHAEKVKLLSSFLEGDWPVDVPDPYYGGDAGFEQVIDMIEAACPKILVQMTSA